MEKSTYFHVHGVPCLSILLSAFRRKFTLLEFICCGISISKLDFKMSETIQELMNNENEEDDDEDDESYEDEDDDDEEEEDEDEDEWSGDEDNDVPIEEDLSEPLFAAILTGDIAVVKSVPGPMDLLQRTNFGSTPLYLAARSGHLDIVRYFIDQGEIQPNDVRKVKKIPHLPWSLNYTLVCHSLPMSIP